MQEAGRRSHFGIGAGACSKELEQWCSSVKPGEGRLAKCMTDQLADEAKPGFKAAKSSAECAAEVAAFKVAHPAAVSVAA